MTTWICATCGVETDSRPEVCPICADDRQYVPSGGQRWRTLEELAASPYQLIVRAIERQL